MKTEYERIVPYITKDGSLVRELMHPDAHGNTRQSLPKDDRIDAGTRSFFM